MTTILHLHVPQFHASYLQFNYMGLSFTIWFNMVNTMIVHDLPQKTIIEKSGNNARKSRLRVLENLQLYGWSMGQLMDYQL